MANIYNLEDTWNAGGTTFNAVWMNISNGASGAPVYAAGSTFFRLSSNGTNVFAIDPNGAITAGGTTVTASTPLLNLTQTWNASGVTCNAILLNVTDTASATASNLINLQKAGTTQFRVDKTGVIYSVQAGNATIMINGGYANYGLGFGGNGQGIFFINSVKAVDVGTRGVTVGSGNGYAWTSTLDATSTADTFMTRPAAATVQYGAADAAAPVAQSISFQSVVAGTSNTAGANATIKGSKGTGTGAGGDIIFQTAAAGSTGTAQNSLAEVFRVRNDGVVGFGTHSAIAAETVTGYITIKDTGGTTRKLAVVS